MQIDAPNELVDSWCHDAMEVLSVDDLLLQCIRLASFSPRVSWSVFGASGGSLRVRRLQAPAGQRGLPLTVFGADGRISRGEVETLLSELEAIDVPTSAGSRIGLDGTARIVRYPGRREMSDVRWWECPEGFESLTSWFERVIAALDGCLPGYTDPGWALRMR